MHWRLDIKVFFALTAVFTLVAWIAFLRVSAEREQELQGVLDSVADRLTQSVADTSNIMQEISAAVELAAKNNATSIVDAYQSFISRTSIHEKRPFLVAIAMIAEVDRARLGDVVRVMNEQEGTPKDDDGEVPFKVLSDGQLDRLNLLISVVPSKRSRNLLGFDLNSSEIRRRTITQATEAKEVVISERVSLRKAGPGVIAAYPMRLAGTPAGERLGPTGSIVVAFATTHLLSEIASEIAPYGLAAEVYDIGPAGTPPRTVLSIDNMISSTVLLNLPFEQWTNDQLLGRQQEGTYFKDLTVGGRQWRVVLGRVASANLLRDYGVVLAVLVAGFVISSLVAFVMRQRLIAERDLEGQVRDRTEALQISEERYKLAIEGSKEGIWDWDCLTNDVVFSPRNREMLGYTEKEFTNDFDAWASRVHPDDLPKTNAAIEAHLKTGKEYEIDYRIRAADGTWHWWRSRGQAIWNADGVPIRFTGMNTDISMEKEQSRLLQEARNKAEAANDAKSRFLATMSHEIRTPMNGIVGMAELLSETTLNSEQKQCADTIHDSAGALLTLINDILDLSKIEAGKVTLQQEPIYVSRLIDDVAQLLSGAAAEKGLNLLVDDRLYTTVGDQPAGPKWFLSDSSRLRQILVNLAGNAVKFTLKGSVTLSAHMEAGAEQGESCRLHISIRDTGIGIPQEKLAKIFDPFEQADDTISRRFEGSGLGLAICSSLISAMNGEISVTSSEWQGTTFNLVFPMMLAESQDSVLDPPVTLPVGTIARLVTGDPEGSEILSRMLRRAGLTVRVAQSGSNSAADYEGHVVVFDVDSQGHLTSENVLAALSEVPEDVPVLVLSNMEFDLPSAKRRITSRRKPLRQKTLEGVLSALLVTDASLRAMKPTAKPDVPDFSERVILVAEDNKTNRLVMQKMLEQSLATIVFAENGAEAVKAFEDDRFDVILMDVSMPVMTGLDASRRIREIEAERHADFACPIVAVTAHAMPEDRENCVAAGMNLVLTKPVKKPELYATLLQALASETDCAADRYGT